MLANLVSCKYLDFGAFGVASFFLVSGFVIPFTLEKSGRRSFLIARLFRIYPTYVVSLCVALLAVYASSVYWHMGFPWDVRTIIANGLLVHEYHGLPSVDLVNWTLIVELWFYLVAAMMSPYLMKGSTLPMLLFGIGAIAFNRYAPHEWAGAGVRLMFISYMFIGTLFWYALKQKIGMRQLLFHACLQFTLFCAAFSQGARALDFPIVPFNYLTALCLFSLLFVKRDRIRPLPILDWLADISYPFYVMHSLIGYAWMRFALAHQCPFPWALLSAIALVGLIATAVHHVVELPATSLGKRLGSLWCRPMKVDARKESTLSS